MPVTVKQQPVMQFVSASAKGDETQRRAKAKLQELRATLETTTRRLKQECQLWEVELEHDDDGIG